MRYWPITTIHVYWYVALGLVDTLRHADWLSLRFLCFVSEKKELSLGASFAVQTDYPWSDLFSLKKLIFANSLWVSWFSNVFERDERCTRSLKNNGRECKAAAVLESFSRKICGFEPSPNISFSFPARARSSPSPFVINGFRELGSLRSSRNSTAHSWERHPFQFSRDEG